jgi:hypothetical protein
MKPAAAVALVLLTGLLAIHTPAYGRAQSELPYALGEAFSTAVRFVRIDRGCKVVDKDADAAFVAFECASDDPHDPHDKDGKVKRGSIELIKVATGVRAQLVLGDDTHGMELRWLELYERKLRDERGTPTPPPPAPEPAPAKAPRDGGA